LKLSIVIPAHNEENRLRPMLEAYAPYFFERYGDDAELIVVVNGSTDRTEGVALAYGADHPLVRTIVEPRRGGEGGAVMIGFREARGELVGFVDADGATPPDAFDDLVRNIGGADAMIATRWHPDSKVSPPQPLKRRIASRCFNGLVRMLFRLPINDTQCGAKVIRREAIQRILPVIGITRWAFDVDLLFQLRRAGYRIVERPTTWHDVGGSQLKVGRASLEMMVAMIRLRLLYSPFRWIVWIYNVLIGRYLHRFL
jgi:glycosyltransferase involved in cell wall biosynthesis